MLEKKIASMLEKKDNYTYDELKSLISIVLNDEASNIYNEIEELIAQKENIESKIAKKSSDLQALKYNLFNTLEDRYIDNETTLENLHQIKLQSLDLLEILDEIIQSSIITTLEKNTNISETLAEIIKDITYESLNASVLNATRIRYIIATIFQSAIDICEASPNQSDLILEGVFVGVDNALYKTIENFHQYLLYAPEELKTLYKQEYETIEIELDNIESLYMQIISSITPNNSKIFIDKLYTIQKELQKSTLLCDIAQKTLGQLRDRLGKIKQSVVAKKEKLNQLKSTQEAKAIGTRAWNVAKKAVNKYKNDRE